MAGTTLDRQLTPPRSRRLDFALATEADDPDIRRLLRENAMRGRISLTLEREPNYFADSPWPGTERQTVIARENGRVVCLGQCAFRERFVNGRSRRVGYLGGLRLDAAAAGRFDILRRGYGFFHELQRARPADLYFTSIAGDNLRARRLLERRPPGMPTYEFVSEYVTALVPVSRHRGRTRTMPEAEPGNLDESWDVLQRHGPACQLAENWTKPELMALARLGLQIERPFIVRENGRAVATAAIWDQRCFKQTVIRGYSTGLSLARRTLHWLARPLNLPELPPIGATLPCVFASPLAVGLDKPEVLRSLIEAIRNSLAGKDVALVALGFASGDPRLAALRRAFTCREYSSRIYLVRWPGLGASSHELDGRCLGLEAALL